MRTLNEEKMSEGNTGEHTEGLKKLDESAIEDPKLVNTVEERLANLNNLTKDVEPDEVDEELDTPIPDVPEDETEEEDGQAAVEGETNTESEAEENEDGQDGTVTIPDALVRAAIHQGWEEDDVKNLIEQNPELALKTLTSCYNSVTNATKEWSALGRAKIQQQRAEAEAQATEQVPPSITPAEIEKLKADYGDDPAVAKLIANAEQLPKVQQTNVQQPADLYNTATARANATANASVDARVNTFFSSDDMGPYKEFYGKIKLSQSVSDLTNGQQEHRLAVMEEAECIMTGLRMRGIEPTIEEVLEKAHLIVTEPIREQVIRSNLKKTAKKRKSGMTFRPAKSKKTGTAVSTSGNDKPKNRQELVSKVGANLARVFGPGN